MGVCLLGCAGVASARAWSLGAAATEEGEGHAGGHSPIFRWINFVILAGGLGFVLRKPLAQFFVARTASITKSLEDGRKALETAAHQLQAVEQKLQHFEEEMAAFRAAALKEMEEEHDHLRQATARDAEKMMESVRVQMDVASKQARLELRLYAAQQAVELAGKMIAQRLDEISQRRLVSQFVARLETGANGSSQSTVDSGR
jgi:F-type H+-transporting ATPase subunit b